MAEALFEHVNYTVSDPRRTADLMCQLFGWKVRWEGPSLGGGHTVHVGTDERYLALYSPPQEVAAHENPYLRRGGLNHVGVLVEDLDAAEARVKSAGLTPHSHQEYEPGRRFYFHDADGIEYEVVSYR